MYKLFLTLRYLTRKKIVIFPILVVWLCVMMLIIVSGIMGGFVDRVRETNHDLLGDIIISSKSYALGFSGYDDLRAALQSDKELGPLIAAVHQALSTLGQDPTPAVVAIKGPAVPVRRSIRADQLICLEDGLPFTSLKRHLHAQHQMTPLQYREKWGLPHDYPMVAPNYSARRSAFAKSIGLGKKAASKARAKSHNSPTVRSWSRRPPIPIGFPS